MLSLSNTEFIIAMASFGALLSAGACWSCWQHARTVYYTGVGTARLPVLFAALTVALSVVIIGAAVWTVTQIADTERMMTFVVIIALAMVPGVLCLLMLGSVIKYEVLRRGRQAWMAAHEPHRSEGPYDFSLHGEAEWRANPERWCVVVAKGAPAHRGLVMERNGVIHMIDDDGLNRALIGEMIKAGVERVDRHPGTGGRIWYGPMDRLEDWIEGVMRRGW